MGQCGARLYIRFFHLLIAFAVFSLFLFLFAVYALPPKRFLKNDILRAVLKICGGGLEYECCFKR
jgi:hypothetical protein